MTRHVPTTTRIRLSSPCPFYFFFFNDTATTEIYTLSLHDALPISSMTKGKCRAEDARCAVVKSRRGMSVEVKEDRKSTRLNSSHGYISYAVFCLKKKNVAEAWLVGSQPSSQGPPPAAPPTKLNSPT